MKRPRPQRRHSSGQPRVVSTGVGAVLLVCGLIFGTPGIAAESEHVREAREQAVLIARAGDVDQAIDRLRALSRQHPANPSILADLVILLRKVGRNAEAVALTRHLPADALPAYAASAWAGALRDQRQFERARQVMLAHSPFRLPRERIFHAMVTSETGRHRQAVALLPDPATPGLAATDLAHMAYVYRRQGDAASALRMCARALQQDPHHRLASQEQVYALSGLGADALAYQLASQRPELIPAAQLDRLRANRTTRHIRNGIRQRDYLDDRKRFREREQPLEQALAELDANLQEFAANGNALQEQNALYDRIVVLHELKRMPEVIQAYRAIGKPEQAIPAYVRLAAAGAFLYQHQPRRAAAIYQAVIAENPGIDVQVYLRLYYALIESEQYEQALQLIEHLHEVTPKWLLPEPPGRGRMANWERLDVDRVWALDAAYRNHEGVAEQRLKTLYDRAPRNIGLINGYATVLRWRGWPEKSARINALALSYAPDDKHARINRANNARELGRYDLWGNTVAELRALFPHDTAIRDSEAFWLDRRQPSISSELVVGRTQGGNILHGNRDRQWNSRLNSPWGDNGWRAYLDHRYTWASFDIDEGRYNRLGAGVEWRWGRKHFWATLSNDRFSGDNVGLAAGWSQWLDDHWQYSLSADSHSTETPLRAQRAGLDGRTFQASLHWRASESRSAYASLGLLAVSDGNRRSSFVAGFSQRLRASAHHITTGGVGLYVSHNSRPGGPYFNPEDSRSVSLRLQHDWITWRHYQRSLTQHFDVSTGSDWQSGFGGAPFIDLLYRHDWRLSRTWALHYGLGWGSHVYDDDRERRLYGVVGFSGVF